MIKFKINSVFYFLLILIAFSSCKKKTEEITTTETGHISFKFSHYVNGSPLHKDSMMYVNAAGNHYEVDQLRYFICNVTLYKSDGTSTVIGASRNINYVDIDIDTTLTWNVSDNIPAGTYDSINFVFGLTADKNKSNTFVNQPQSNMAWPDVLGGGYHYMQMNGKWLDSTSTAQNFNFHLGIGQLYKSNVINVDSIYAFVQNYFTASLPHSSFTLSNNSTNQIEIIMNIDSWFTTPHNFDFNYWGGTVMQNQSALQVIKENGHDVFTIGYIK